MHHDNVLIVDFGSQVTQLIARRVREAGVYCEIHPFSKAAEAFARLAAQGGDPLRRPGLGSAKPAARARRRQIFDCGVPILGICYGQQTMCAAARRQGRGRPRREFGRAEVEIVEPCALFDGVWNGRRAIRSG